MEREGAPFVNEIDETEAIGAKQAKSALRGTPTTGRVVALQNLVAANPQPPCLSLPFLAPSSDRAEAARAGYASSLYIDELASILFSKKTHLLVCHGQRMALLSDGKRNAMARFQGKIFLISGGARGMGAAEARLLAAEGAKVVVGDILEAEGAELAAEIGPACVFVRLDVGESADWAKAVAAAEALGGLDGLVNNAGIYQPATLADADLANWERHLRVNQTGVFLGMKSAAGAMKARGGGSIVNLSSTVGLRSAPNAIAYTATKWAVRGMSKAAALELAGDNIRVNSVHPGPIDTEMLSIRSREENLRRVQQVPLKRLGATEEVARLVLYLLSDDAAYITGAEMAIDGGAAL